MKSRPEWFAAKRFGYGFAFPIAWQGWAVFFAYCALLYLAAQNLEPPSDRFWFAVAMLTALFLLIAYFTTKGGWRFRQGEDD